MGVSPGLAGSFTVALPRRGLAVTLSVRALRSSSGSLSLASTSMVTSPSSLALPVSATASGRSLTSVTSMVTVTVSEAFEGSLALTVTLCEGAVSWSSEPSATTLICPLLLSIVNRSDLESSYVTTSPLSLSVALTDIHTAARARAFSRTLRVGADSSNDGATLPTRAALTELADTTERLLSGPCPSVYAALTRRK